MNADLPENHSSKPQSAWTVIEVLVMILLVYVPIALGQFVARNHGLSAGIGAGAASAVICGIAVVLFYRAHARQRENRRRELREKYLGIYRVLAIPDDATRIIKPDGAEVRVGDYGWEAEPFHDDGLIYLQGLTPKWGVVWYAGFRPDQIERIGSKPQSQYDWTYSWVSSPPPCLFPVQPRETPDYGLPMPGMGYSLRRS